MFKLPLFSAPTGTGKKAREAQPFSRQTLTKAARIEGATVTESVCPYCAVGCGQHIYTKGGQIIDIEGNPHSPINEGTLCPKGANVFQLARNPHRVKHVLYRAPYATEWEQKPLEWAMEKIAQKVKDARESGWAEKDDQGRTIKAVRNLGCLGGATLDNEENYLIKKLFSAGLGVLSVENQARI